MSNQHRVINRPVYQKFCKVCQDAGKSLAEYTSHNVRETQSPSSRVTCPTLLAQECRFCFNKGHSLKYCPQIKNKEAGDAVRPAPAPVTKQAFKAPTNVFAMLSDGDSEEEGEVKEEKAKMPIASKTRRVNFSSVIATFSEVPARAQAQAPAAQAVAAPAWSSGIKRMHSIRSLVIPVPAAKVKPVKPVEAPATPVVIRIKSVVMRGRWADCDLDEENEFYSNYESVYAN
jgi:hypothetical protein